MYKLHKEKNDYKTNILIYCLIALLVIINISNVCIAESYSDTKTIDWNRLKERSQHILESNDKNILANFQYSISLANLGMIVEAFEHFEVIEAKISIDEFNKIISPHISKLEELPNDILLLNYTAFSATINSDYQKSLPYFKRILELEPKNVWIKNFLAANYIELEEYQKAKKEVNTALEIMDNKYSHLILGFIYYETGNYLGALIELGRSGDLANKVLFN